MEYTTTETAGGDAGDALDLLDRPTWWTDASCRYVGRPGLFFDDEPEAVAEAKAICRTCPAQQPCLVHTLTVEATLAVDEPMEMFGVFGGLDAAERRAAINMFRESGLLPGVPVPISQSWQRRTSPAVIAALLDELGISVDVGDREAKALLRRAGYRMRLDSVGYANQRRRRHIKK